MSGSSKNNITYGVYIHLQTAAKLCFDNRHKSASQKKEKIGIFVVRLQRYLTAEYYEIHEQIRKTLGVLRGYLKQLGDA